MTQIVVAGIKLGAGKSFKVGISFQWDSKEKDLPGRFKNGFGRFFEDLNEKLPIYQIKVL